MRDASGAVVVRSETHGLHAPDTSEGQIVGWATIRELRLTRGLRAEQVIVRARRELRRAGWRIGIGSDFYFNAEPEGLVSAPPAAWRTRPSRRARRYPEVTATDEAPTEDKLPPGKVIAHGLFLKVSDC